MIIIISKKYPDHIENSRNNKAFDCLSTFKKHTDLLTSLTSDENKLRCHLLTCSPDQEIIVKVHKGTFTIPLQASLQDVNVIVTIPEMALGGEHPLLFL